MFPLLIVNTGSIFITPPEKFPFDALVFDLTGPSFEPQTSHSRDERPTS